MMVPMHSSKYLKQLLACIFCMLLPMALTGAELLVQPTPDGGLQPRLIVDETGNVHLLYFKKRLNQPQAREGNLFYRQYDPTSAQWGNPVKVSSSAFNLQTFSIARAGLAIDGTGRIHVIWYLPKEAQYVYARSDTARTTFEPQLSMVSQYAEGIDAGADIAAKGNQIAIVWGAGDLSKESARTVYARVSVDNGDSFGEELMLGDTGLGACACCSLATDFSQSGDLRVAYRSAIDGVGRHMQLLTLALAQGAIARSTYADVHELQQWELSSCPLSTNDIAADSRGDQWLVFETAARIVQMKLDGDPEPSLVAEPAITTRQKNPAIALDSAGQRLVVWGEAISHSRGGKLNMRMFDADGASIKTDYDTELEITEFSFPAAAPLPNNSFLILY